MIRLWRCAFTACDQPLSAADLVLVFILCWAGVLTLLLIGIRLRLAYDLRQWPFNRWPFRPPPRRLRGQAAARRARRTSRPAAAVRVAGRPRQRGARPGAAP